MGRLNRSVTFLAALAAYLALTGGAFLRAAAKPGNAAKPEIVAGVVIDEERKGPTYTRSVTVKEDGQETPVKYIVDSGLDKRTTDALNTIFSVSRVRLTYKLDGEVRHLTGIEKVVGRQSGVVIGAVVETHGWWVEVKPKDGPPEGYACNFPKEKWQATEEQIKTLEKGDTVAIKFTTDGERHRIVQMEKKEKAK